MAKMRKRLVLDGMLTALLVFEMLYQLTGNVLHEVAGIVFFAAIIVHLVLSRKWIAATVRAVGARKRMKGAAVARMAVNVLLALVMAVLLASSIAISNLLFGLGIDLAGGAYGTWAMVHTACSYALCCLTVVHLALHWATMAAAFRIPYDPGRRTAISAGVAAIAALGVLGLELNGVSALAKPVSAAAGSAQGDGSGESTSSDAGADGDAPSPLPPVSQNGSDAAPQVQEDGGASAGKQSGRRKGGRGIESQGDGYGGGSGAVPSAPGSGSDGSEAADGGSQGGSDSSSGTTASGICTLCRKRCPLSAPKCNLPYQAGLI